MSGNFSGGSFSGAVGGFSVDASIAVSSTATPGLVRLPRQVKVEDEADKLARRIREGTIQLPAAPEPDPLLEYHRQSAKLAEAVAVARAEAFQLRGQIDVLERRILAAIAEQRERFERQLLIAQQRAAFIAVQEAQLLEEREILGIAYITAVVLVTLQ